MSCLDSIFETIELIKKKYSNFKIKVASVQLRVLNKGDDENLWNYCQPIELHNSMFAI